MIFWGTYIFASICLAYLLSSFFNKKLKEFLFIIFLIFLLTPNLIEISSSRIAPSIFIFFYDLILEAEFSLRSLRPLVFSLPIGILIFTIFKAFKRRFSQKIDL